MNRNINSRINNLFFIYFAAILLTGIIAISTGRGAERNVLLASLFKKLETSLERSLDAHPSIDSNSLDELEITSSEIIKIIMEDRTADSAGELGKLIGTNPQMASLIAPLIKKLELETIGSIRSVSDRRKTTPFSSSSLSHKKLIAFEKALVETLQSGVSTGAAQTEKMEAWVPLFSDDEFRRGYLEAYSRSWAAGYYDGLYRREFKPFFTGNLPAGTHPSYERGYRTGYRIGYENGYRKGSGKKQ